MKTFTHMVGDKIYTVQIDDTCMAPAELKHLEEKVLEDLKSRPEREKEMAKRKERHEKITKQIDKVNAQKKRIVEIAKHNSSPSLALLIDEYQTLVEMPQVEGIGSLGLYSNREIALVHELRSKVPYDEYTRLAELEKEMDIVYA